MTNFVFSERRSLRSEGSNFGFSLVFGSHHLRTRFWRAARETQEAMLASWSILEMTSSEPGGKSRAYDRFRKSWVVDPPRTWVVLEVQTQSYVVGDLPISSGEALIYLAAAEYPASYRLVAFWPIVYVAPSWTLVAER